MGKSVLFVCGGGIGNIIQATPTIRAIANAGYTTDLRLHCDSTNDLNIFQLDCIRNLYTTHDPVAQYDFQLNGIFTPFVKHKAKICLYPKINYAQHIEEAVVHYDLARQLGINTPIPNIEIKIPDEGVWPKSEETIAIFPGSKPNWSMKRWDKYDELVGKFENVIVIGAFDDIYSHGSPTWIKKPWQWPDNVGFFTGELSDVAFLISKCKAFIGNDGGLSHIAAATGIPTFILFGPSSVVKNKPFANNAHAIAINLPCRPCQFRTGPNGRQIFAAESASCPFNMKCMKDMTVEYVYKEISRILR